MLFRVVSARQTDWDDFLLPCVYAHNNHLSRATGLAPTELHIGRYPRLPMTILGSQKSVRGMPPKKRDDLNFLQLMRNVKLKRTSWQSKRISSRTKNTERTTKNWIASSRNAPCIKWACGSGFTTRSTRCVRRKTRDVRVVRSLQIASKRSWPIYGRVNFQSARRRAMPFQRDGSRFQVVAPGSADELANQPTCSGRAMQALPPTERL